MPRLKRTCFALNLFTIAILLFCGCQNKGLKSGIFGEASIQPLFEETIDTRQNLVFRFPKAIVKPEALGIWDTTSYFRITPHVSGQYKWAAIDELVFSPDKSFAFATNYSASPSNALVSIYPAAQETEIIRFETAQLKIENIEGQWHKENEDLLWLKLRIYVNQAILPDEMGTGIEINIDGKAVAFELEEHSPSNVIRVKLKSSGLNSEREKLEIKASLNPEKASASLKKWLKTRSEYSGSISGIKKLEVYGLSVEYGEKESAINLRLNQSILDSSSQNWIEIPGMEGYKTLPSKDGLVIKGLFSSNISLELIVKKGLKGTAGGILEADKTIGFQLGNENALVRFTNSKAIYLPKSGNREIAMQLEGVADISISVYQVFPNNILQVIQNQGNYYNDDYGYEVNNSYFSEYEEENGTLVWSRNFKVNALARNGNSYLVPMDFNALPGQKGIFIVKISDSEKRFIGAKKIISVTDLGILAKTSQKEVWVKIKSLSENEAIEKVKVTVIGENNQALFTAESNHKGEAIIPNFNLLSLGTRPKMIVAEKNNDFTYLHFGQTRLETSRFPLDGNPYTASGLQAEIFGPRNLFKPGEKINLQVLVRDQNLTAAGDLPLIANVLNPMGKSVLIQKLKTGVFGNCKLDFEIPNYLPTGSYQIEIMGPEKDLLGSHNINIETFDPLPLEIQSGNVPPSISLQKNWDISLKVDNMFGLPASERPIQVQLSTETAEFQPEKYKSFNFNLNYVEGNSKIYTVEGATNTMGLAKLTLPTSQIPDEQGLLKLKAKIQVYDESQIPVYKTLTTKMLTQPFLLGYFLPGNQLYFKKLNKFNLVSVNEEGKMVPGMAHIEIFQKTYSSVMELAPNEPNGYRYVSKTESKLISKTSMALPKGNGIFNFIPKFQGEYEIQIKTNPKSSRYLSGNFYVYENSNDAPPEEEANTEGNIEITCDQKDLKPGDIAKVRFNCPFEGKMEVTLEQNRILQSHTLEVKGKTALLEIPITSEMAPNVFVFGALTRPFNGQKNHNPQTVAYGYSSLPVVLSEKELKTKLKLPENIRSGTRQKVEITLESNEDAGIALAVADEGILQITNYKIPDPFLFMNRKKALAVETFSMSGKIFSSASGSKSKTGGDGMYMKMAADGLENKAMVSTFLVSEKPGKEPKSDFQLIQKGKHKTIIAYFDVPSGFAGKLRVMAVTFSKQKLGFAEKTITVSDPITIKATIPEYLFPGDYFEGNVSYFNTSQVAITFAPKINQKGVDIQAIDWPESLLLKPGQMKRFSYSISAKTKGEGLIKITAKSPNGNFELERKLTVNNPNWLVRKNFMGEILPGKSATVSKPDFISNQGISAKVEISQNPFTILLPSIKSLLRYPYGCLEQTVSAAFPLLYLPSEWLENHDSEVEEDPNQHWKKNAYLSDAIQKISNLQQSGGGFSYWPGSGSVQEYYSVYATHFLLEARQAGYSVNPKVLEKAIGFVLNLSREKTMVEFSNPGKNGKKEYFSRLAPRIAYALYVTSLAGKQNQEALRQWKSQPGKLDQEGKFMVACALMQSGDAEGFSGLIPNSWQNSASLKPADVKLNGQNGYLNEEVYKTSTQEEAFVLACLAREWPDHPVTRMLANRLKTKITLNPEMVSTQELGMAIVGLTKLIKSNASNETKFMATLGNRSIISGKAGKASFSDWSSPLKITNQNKKGSMFYWVQAQGKNENGNVPEEENGLEVRKTTYDVNGRPKSLDQLAINDLVVIRLQLKSTTGSSLKQIALVDVVPSCFRIENKRINQNSDFKTVDFAAEPDYLDIRRDRINIFCEADVKEKSFYYAARVVSKGTYNWGHAEAQAMYQPEIFSRSGGKKIRISERILKDLAKR